MSRSITISIITCSTNRYDRAIIRKSNRITRTIISRFPVNIRTNLSPSTRIILINADMSRSITISIITISTNRYDRAVLWEGDRTARTITTTFAIDIRTNLGPSTRIILINADMSSITHSTNRYDRAIIWEGDRTASIIICRFPINIRTNLSPSTRIILINANMTSVCTITIIEISTNRHNRAIFRNGYRMTISIIRSFAI